MGVAAVWCICGTAFAQSGASLSIDHDGPLVLGEVDRVSVTITAPETQEVEGRPLRVSVNVGAFGEVQRIASGKYQTEYTLPSTRFPQIAFVAVWRETGPKATVDFLRIPLSGRANVTVMARRNAGVAALVGDQSYGPVQANRRGKAVVPLAVPPGIDEVIAQSTVNKEVSQKTVPIQIPPYNRLTLAVSPYLVEADGQSDATVHVYYDVVEPPPISNVNLTVSGGTLTPLGAEKNRYRFRYVPIRGTTAQDVMLSVQVNKDKSSAAKAQLRLGTPVPERVVVRSTDLRLVADGLTESELRLLVLDRLGLGVEKLPLTATIAAGNVSSTRDLGSGEYAVTLTSAAHYPQSGMARVSIQVDGQHSLAKQIDIPVEPAPWPTQATLNVAPSIPIADGDIPFDVEIMALDGAGRPFDGAELSLTADRARTGPIESLGGGRYLAQVIPESGLERLSLELSDTTGHVTQVQTVRLRNAPRWLTVGARAGATFNAGTLIPTGGLEVGFRPPILSRRFGVTAGAMYRRLKRGANVGGVLLDDRGAPDSHVRLQFLPIFLRAHYDFYGSASWRMYGGAGGHILAFEYSPQNIPFSDETERGVSPGVDLTLGAEYSGFFLELVGGLTAISSASVEGPVISAGVTLGFRVGVL